MAWTYSKAPTYDNVIPSTLVDILWKRGLRKVTGNESFEKTSNEWTKKIDWRQITDQSGKC